jgi:transcriptional regulator with XRE-family HTH domain
MWDWLTYDLRFLCKKYGLSVNEFARKLQRSPSNASNILAGRRRINDKDAKILDTEYDTGEHYTRILRWARRGHSPSWSQQYVEFERETLIVRTFEALTIKVTEGDQSV